MTQDHMDANFNVPVSLSTPPGELHCNSSAPHTDIQHHRVSPTIEKSVTSHFFTATAPLENDMPIRHPNDCAVGCSTLFDGLLPYSEASARSRGAAFAPFRGSHEEQSSDHPAALPKKFQPKTDVQDSRLISLVAAVSRQVVPQAARIESSSPVEPISANDSISTEAIPSSTSNDETELLLFFGKKAGSPGFLNKDSDRQLLMKRKRTPTKKYDPEPDPPKRKARRVSTGGASAKKTKTADKISSKAVKTANKPSCTPCNEKRKPRRNMSAYNMFFNLERKRLIAKEPPQIYTKEDVASIQIEYEHRPPRSHKKNHESNLGFHELTQTVGSNWKSYKDKSVFDERVILEKELYLQRLADWRESCEMPDPVAAKTNSKPKVKRTLASKATKKNRVKKRSRN